MFLFRLVIQQQWRLGGIGGWDGQHAQHSRQLVSISEREEPVWRFAIQDFAFHAVDMGEHQIGSFLRKPAKAFPFWDDVAEKRIVLLYPGILARAVRAAKKNLGLRLAIGAFFKRSHI